MPLLEKLAPLMVAKLIERMDNEGLTGVPMGIVKLDKATNGLGRQEISYLLGKSGYGKSWLGTFITLSTIKWLCEGNRPMSGYLIEEGDDENEVALRNKIAEKKEKTPVVVYWSLEMDELSVYARLLAQSAGRWDNINVSAHGLIAGKSNYASEEMIGLANANARLGNDFGKHLFLEFNHATISGLKEALNNLVESDHDIVLIIIDYFRLIQVPGADVTGVAKQEKVSSDLKELARFYDAHVLSIFDLNQVGASRNIPTIWDMKWGTASVYDADYIFLLGRKEEEGWDSQFNVEKDTQLNIGKMRNGPSTHANFTFNMANGTLVEWKV